MKFGNMRDRIDVQEYTSTLDDWNTEVKQWTTKTTVWAEKKYKNSQLVSEVEGLTHVMQVIFRVRYMDDITTKMRVRQGSEDYDIVGMRQYGNKEVLELITVKRDANSGS